MAEQKKRKGRRSYLNDFYRDVGIPTALEMNPGGHFNDPTGRMARAIAWVLEA